MFSAVFLDCSPVGQVVLFSGALVATRPFKLPTFLPMLFFKVFVSFPRLRYFQGLDSPQKPEFWPRSSPPFNILALPSVPISFTPFSFLSGVFFDSTCSPPPFAVPPFLFFAVWCYVRGVRGARLFFKCPWHSGHITKPHFSLFWGPTSPPCLLILPLTAGPFLRLHCLFLSRFFFATIRTELNPLPTQRHAHNHSFLLLISLIVEVCFFGSPLCCYQLNVPTKSLILQVDYFSVRIPHSLVFECLNLRMRELGRPF